MNVGRNYNGPKVQHLFLLMNAEELGLFIDVLINNEEPKNAKEN